MKIKYPAILFLAVVLLYTCVKYDDTARQVHAGKPDFSQTCFLSSGFTAPNEGLVPLPLSVADNPPVSIRQFIPLCNTHFCGLVAQNAVYRISNYLQAQPALTSAAIPIYISVCLLLI